MPLSTFFNLSAERQKEIVNICFEEFAVNDFESASLSNIIKKSGVAKGSFYRYFESKDDLFLYLFRLSKDLMEAEFKTKMHQSNKDFFDNWSDYLKSLFKIENEYPMLLKFQLKNAFDVKLNGQKKSTGDKLSYKIDYFRDIVIASIAKDEIRNDIPVDIVSTVIVYAQLSIMGYLQFALHNQEATESAQKLSNMPEKQMDDILNNFMKIIYSGIKKQ